LRDELGLATAAGARLGIHGIADLARPGIRIVNRELGAGARAFLDEALSELGIDATAIEGYDFEAAGHLEVAAAIASGRADAGVTIRLAAEAYELPFISIREECYDLVILARDVETAPVKAMLDTLNTRRFALEVSQLCAYDTNQMGQVTARNG
jgi:molybdopterin molybdotransferase/putative molybdopterin biosynthesis protein